MFQAERWRGCTLWVWALKLYASVAKGLKLKKTKNVLAAISDVSRSYSGRTGREGPNSSIQIFNMGKAFC